METYTMILGFDPVHGGISGGFPVEGESIEAHSFEEAEQKFNEMEIPYMNISKIDKD